MFTSFPLNWMFTAFGDKNEEAFWSNFRIYALATLIAAPLFAFAGYVNDTFYIRYFSYVYTFLHVLTLNSFFLFH